MTKSFELNHFKGTSREDLENMTEREIWSLDRFQQIERYLIVNGYTDHNLCRKIEMFDIRATGADSYEFEILSTKKRCRKPSFYHIFALNEIHHAMLCIEHGEF